MIMTTAGGTTKARGRGAIVSALHGAEHRDRRGDDAVAVEQGCAEQADEHQRPARLPQPAGLIAARAR